MPRSIWTGAISFGLVSVPVKLYSSTESKTVHFHEFQEGTDRRIQHRRFAEGTDEEVPYEEIVKGYEYEDGKYVIVTKEELESVEPGRSRTIDIQDFVSLDEIDPIYFEKSYHLAPAEGGRKPYALLRAAMERSGRVAIGHFVMRTKQYLAAIRASGDALVLETMYFGDEVRSTDPLDLPDAEEVDDRELAIADQLIDSLTVTFDPDAYRDTYRERVLDLIEQKAKGERIVVDRDEEPSATVTDLMSALEESVKAARGRRTGGDDERSNRLDDLTKDELYDRAADSDIDGRSKMSKRELVEALREAS